MNDLVSISNFFFQELDKAKRVINDLEADLQVERSRLRTLTTEQSRIQRQKDDVLLQLKRTESVSCGLLDSTASCSCLLPL